MFKLHRLLAVILTILLSLSALAQAQHQVTIVLDNQSITRITPIFPRVEYTQQAKFVYEKTLVAYDRSPLIDDFTMKQINRISCEFETSDDLLHADNNSFPALWGQYSTTPKKHGKKLEIKGGGVTSALDLVLGRENPSQELKSRIVGYLIDNTGWNFLVETQLQPRNRSHFSDRYYFVYRDNYNAAFASLGAISGLMSMPSKIMQGFRYCRWCSYTAGQYYPITNSYDIIYFPHDGLHPHEAGYPYLRTAPEQIC